MGKSRRFKLNERGSAAGCKRSRSEAAEGRPGAVFEIKCPCLI